MDCFMTIDFSLKKAGKRMDIHGKVRYLANYTVYKFQYLLHFCR